MPPSNSPSTGTWAMVPCYVYADAHPILIVITNREQRTRTSVIDTITRDQVDRARVAEEDRVRRLLDRVAGCVAWGRRGGEKATGSCIRRT